MNHDMIALIQRIPLDYTITYLPTYLPTLLSLTALENVDCCCCSSLSVLFGSFASSDLLAVHRQHSQPHQEPLLRTPAVVPVIPTPLACSLIGLFGTSGVRYYTDAKIKQRALGLHTLPRNCAKKMESAVSTSSVYSEMQQHWLRLASVIVDSIPRVLKASPLLASSVVVVTLFSGYCAFTVYKWRRISRQFVGFASTKLRHPYTLLGHLPTMAQNYDRILDVRQELRLESGAKTCCNPMPVWAGHMHLNTVDPVVVKHILKDDFDAFIKGYTLNSSLESLLGKGIFAIDHGPESADEGKAWLQQRKTASRIFTRNAFRNYMFQVFSKHAAIVGDVIDKQLETSGRVVEMQNLMFKYTLDSIGQIGFGVELHTLTQESPFQKAFDESQKLIIRRFLRPFWRIPVIGRLMYSEERLLSSHIRDMDKFAHQVIEQRRSELLAGKLDEHEDILSLFMADDEAQYNDKLLRDVVMSFVIAGRDTTACTLSFALMLLATHPDEQNRLRGEIKAALGSRTDRILNLDELKPLRLLNGVVNEALRLYPPVSSDVKEAARDSTLPDGRLIPKGSRISYEPYQMGRDPSLWSNPLKFDPDRWISAKPTQYEFPVFQAGPRVCLGQSMATFEAGLLIAYLVDRYEFSCPDPKREFKYAPGITLTVKDGLDLEVRKVKSL